MILDIYVVFDERHKKLTGVSRWHFEAEGDRGLPSDEPGPEVIHSDGFYDTPQEAIEAGEEWAEEHGHTVRRLMLPR